jgi:predicted flap endonuclease-1-like 5' DNA nuclease
MFEKIKKVIQEDLQRRYEQLEERFLIFEQNLYGRLSDRLENLENQLDQISEILRQNITRNKAESAANLQTDTQKTKKEPKGNKNTATKEENIQSDDLQKLAGLGSMMEKKLHAEGVYTFRQLANLTDTELEKLSAKIPGMKIRYERYEWKKAARELI